MKTICRFFNNVEAEFARSLLVSVGIKAVLAEAHANVLGPGFAPGGVRLQVPDEEVERALEILNGEDGEFTPLPDEFVPPEEVPGANEVVSREGFGGVPELIPAGLCLLLAMAAVYGLYMRLAPLSWTHTSTELGRMALAAMDKKDYAKAVKYFDAALVVNPQSYRAFYNRGLAFFEEKNDEKAIADVTEALHLNPQHVRSYRMRSVLYRRMGAYDKALEDINKAIALEPNTYKGYCTRGLLYAKLGDAGKAIQDDHRVVDLAPERWVGYNNLAWVYATWPQAEVRDGAKALELALKACELSGWKDYYCIGTLAAAEAETGKFDDALKHQQQALAMARADQAIDGKMLDQMADALADFQQKRPYRDLKK